jgi:uncharacterized protein YbjT (DUF2867 family)
MIKPTVLVIGATGSHGRTGSTVVDHLLSHDRSVRVLVRRDDDRAAALRERGAQTVVGDLHERGTLVAAVADTTAVYFAYPIAAGVVPAAANLASVLREAELLPHLVVMSMAPSAHRSPSMLGQAQVIAEEILIWAGLNPTILRVAALFHENVLTLHGRQIREEGRIENSFGPGRAPWIGGRDAAELAARTLLRPAPSSAEVTYPPGAEALSHAEIAEIIGAETARTVSYAATTQEEWRHTLEHQAEHGGPSPVNRAMAQHISALGASLAAGTRPAVAPDPTALASLLGRLPETFAEYVRRHRGDFLAESSAPGAR